MSATSTARPVRTGNQRMIAVLAVPEGSVTPVQWAEAHGIATRALRATDEVTYGTRGRINITLSGVRDMFTAAELMEVLRDTIVANVPQARDLAIGIALWGVTQPGDQARTAAEHAVDEALGRGDGRIITHPPLA